VVVLALLVPVMLMFLMLALDVFEGILFPSPPPPPDDKPRSRSTTTITDSETASGASSDVRPVHDGS
jgi:hypothetical protein